MKLKHMRSLSLANPVDPGCDASFLVIWQQVQGTSHLQCSLTSQARVLLVLAEIGLCSMLSCSPLETALAEGGVGRCRF